MITAREAIVSDKSSNIYKMTSFEIGFLYINELLDREISRRRKSKPSAWVT